MSSSSWPPPGRRLERAELLTPVPRADVNARVDAGQDVRHEADAAAPGGYRYWLVEPIVLSVEDLPTRPPRRPGAELELAGG